uniref:Uncharacterized protein n=2 Tax=Oryza TaxID=4527 RepID=A0A0E0B3A2_9ORYZ
MRNLDLVGTLKLGSVLWIFLPPVGINISRAIKRAEVEATPVTRKSPEKLLKFRLLEPMTISHCDKAYKLRILGGHQQDMV